MNTDCLKICIFDVETTGLPTGNDYSKVNIIEIAWVIVDKNMNVLKQQSMLINGDFHISNFIKNLTGISKEMTLSGGLPLMNVFNKFYEDLKECSIIMAHNLIFDYNMVLQEIKNLFKEKNKSNELEYYQNMFKSKIRLCSRNILRKECSEREIKVENYKLQTLHNTLTETNTIQQHRAIGDVYMIMETIQTLEEFDLLYYFWNKKLVFGTHKDKTNEWVYDNDRKYFDWLLKDVYMINTENKKRELLYQDEEYVEDNFVVNETDSDPDYNTDQSGSNISTNSSMDSSEDESENSFEIDKDGGDNGGNKRRRLQ